MNKYYVQIHEDESGNHQVHKEGCEYSAEPENMLFLGVYSSCAGAVNYARQKFPKATGCWYCSRECYIR